MKMWKYILKRVLLMFCVLFIITTIYFVLIRMLPRELPLEKVQAEAIKARWEALGYNKPLLIQYWIYLKNIFTKLGVNDRLSAVREAIERGFIR